MIHLFAAIRLVATGTRGVTPTLAQEIIAAIKESPGPLAEELRESFRPYALILTRPTLEDCLRQLELLQFELDELGPWVDNFYPEHRSEFTLGAFLAADGAVKHFQRKLHSLIIADEPICLVVQNRKENLPMPVWSEVPQMLAIFILTGFAVIGLAIMI